MYNGIGLGTPRGSGTNGYVQRNLAFVRETKIQQKIQYNQNTVHRDTPVEKEPNTEILDHERKRQLEVKVYEWAEKNGILDQNISELELDKILAQKRKELAKEPVEPKKEDPKVLQRRQWDRERAQEEEEKRKRSKKN